MTTEAKQDLLAKLRGAYSIWFVTVREDGMPQPTPVWFVPDGDDFLIYTNQTTQKLKNLQANPKVSLAYATDVEANGYIVATGEASIDTSAPNPVDNAAYFKKYEEGFRGINMTPDAFRGYFTVAIRVKVNNVRGE